ncbi:hypothetical protein [Paraburkholderia bonniea]|uniref:hypothetical protein n=1 Tax=Paraburkholderia bonniea TaxID=2152891 RepID=UPI0012916A8D|nr:hypothetical protein [Paraburkholderia bonniea]
MIHDDGSFQIDNESVLLQLVNRQSAATGVTSLATVYNNQGAQFYGKFFWCKFTFTAENPLFAFTADNGVMVTPWKFNRSGDGKIFTAEFISAAPTTIHFFVFDRANPTDSGFGAQLFTEDGTNLLFDACTPFAQVVDVIEGAYIGGEGWDGTGGTTFPSENRQSKQYEFPVLIAGMWPAHHMNGAGNGNSAMDSCVMSAVSISGGDIAWEFHRYYSQQGFFTGFRESTRYRFMVLNATGIVN